MKHVYNAYSSVILCLLILASVSCVTVSLFWQPSFRIDSVTATVIPGLNFEGTCDFIMYSHNYCLSYTNKSQCISASRIVDAFLFLECLPTLLFCIVTCCIKR